ncbi:integrase/recombinase, partial [mine drainage metagenome]
MADPDLKRWYANVARGSPITADVYLRRLGAFCEQTKTTPRALLDLTEKARHDLLLDFVSEEERKKRAGSYIQSSLKAVKSWLLHHGLRVNLPIRIQGAQDTPTLRDERTPTPEELRRIFLAAKSRDRVSCALMAHAGLRPEVLGNYLGTDGLRLRDLPELRIEGKGVT